MSAQKENIITFFIDILKVYRETYRPKNALRFSMQDLHKDDSLLNIPLNLLHNYTRWLPEA